MSAAKKKSTRRKSTVTKSAIAKSSTAKVNALKNTVRVGSGAAASLKHLSWKDVELEAMNPLLGRQLIVGHQVMLARVLLKKGCVVSFHSHVNEQVSYILEGALKFGIDGRQIVVRAGEVLAIPSNMPHQAEAIEDTVALDVFNPPRADWMNKTDAYLRK